MGMHHDDDGNGVADRADDPAVFVPGPEHWDSDDQATMMMGWGRENDLRDPFFHTPEGEKWLHYAAGGR